MTIHKEGYQSIGITALIFGLINIASFIFLADAYPKTATIIFIGSVFLFLFIVSFFRIPYRSLTKGEA
ncbi:MAG TPA: phosphatidylserine decarboxylase family protein, partial [Segetibacter sp.]